MIKKILSLVLIGCLGRYAYGMDAEWFYDQNNPYKDANQLYQSQEWASAGALYSKLLEERRGSSYDQAMAKLNCASCSMALSKESPHWAAFDELIKIGHDKRLPAFCNRKQELGSILVRTDQVGIGDLFHFIEAVNELNDQVSAQITLSIRPSLQWAFKTFTEENNIILMSDQDEKPDTKYETHLVSLMGYLNLRPLYLDPEQCLFTAPESAILKISAQLKPAISQGQPIAAVFLGKKGQATLIGGKQLPRDMHNHGRELDAAPFISLLKKYPRLMLLNGGSQELAAAAAEKSDLAARIMPIAHDTNFDTYVALGRYMSCFNNLSETKHKIVAIGADNGPTNVFARSLDGEAQEYMAFIIPNAREHDMRMHGDGTCYKQNISNCWIYRCDKPSEQEEIIDQAYRDMTQQ